MEHEKSRTVNPQTSTTGFGCPETTDPHRFEVDIPPGRTGAVSIVECYGIKAGIGGLPEVAERCLLARPIWSLIAEDVKREFNERLRARKLAASRWTVGINKVERLLGKELLVLAWAVEDALPEAVPNAIRNWIGLRPEERWWLFNITAAATGFPEHAGVGWRKALRFALTENPLAEQVRDESAANAAKAQKRRASSRNGSRDSDGETNQLLLLTQSPDEPSPFLDTPPDTIRSRSGNTK
jgi:hypothetical protein